MIYQHCLARGRELGDGIETHILSSNTGWLRFAKAHGFVEVETYLLPCCGLLRVRRSRQHRPRLLPPGRHLNRIQQGPPTLT